MRTGAVNIPEKSQNRRATALESPLKVKSLNIS
jgi:hypothetical protein